MRQHIVLIAILFFSSKCYSQVEGEVFRFKDGSYCAAIKTEIFEYFKAKQNYDNWCWAACIQMALNYQGIKVHQSDIVRKVYGGTVNAPGNCYQMQVGASGWRAKGVTIKAWQKFNPDAGDMIKTLAHKYPLVIGLNMPGQNIGHAYVLTAIYYTCDGDCDRPNKKPYSVILRDPWPGNESKLEIDWFDFASRINCILHITY
jgi:hypothetical protein